MPSFVNRKVMGSAVVAAIAALCAGHIACSREPTAVIVAVTTDMVVDGDLDELGLYVGVAGEIKTSLRTPTSADQPAKLPGTLSILQPSDESTPVHVRVAGYKKGELKVVRDAITTVPSGQLSLLRVPLSWLASTHKAGGSALTLANTGSNVKIRDAVPGDNSFSEFAQFFPGYVSPCAQGQTSNDGECVDATAQVTKISSGDLMREVYGGALGVDQNGVAEGGTCFDIDSCFANEQTLKQVDYQDCKVRIPAGLNVTKTVNFAAVRNEESGCTGKSCLVPLDWDGKYDEATSTFTFAPQVCKRIGGANAKTATVRIAVATNCDAKVASRPRCNGLFGAVRDKAPSESRTPYYSDDPIITDGGQPLPDGAPPIPKNDAGPDAGPPGPVLLGTLRQVVSPRRIVFANDRLWVRGRQGMAFLDSRGASTPTELFPLPVPGGGTDGLSAPLALVAVGNSACSAFVETQKTVQWCYDLTTSTRANFVNYIKGLSVVGSTIGVASGNAGNLAYAPDYPTGGAGGRIDNIAPNDAIGFGQAGDRGLVAVASPTFSEVRITSIPLAVADIPTTTFATVPAPYSTYPNRVELASNASEVFFTAGRSDDSTGVILRKSFVNAGPSPATVMNTDSVPYGESAQVPTLVADANFVYWGGGANGPMYMSTCATGSPAPRSVIAGFTLGGNVTTFAVARAADRVFFATEDGRVYSHAAPVAQPCP